MPAENHISVQLKQLLSDRKITATELSRMSGVRTSFIYDVLSGKSKNPSIITLSKIANALAIPLSDISGNDAKESGVSAATKPPANYVSVPKLNIDISASDGAEADQNEFDNIEYYMFRQSWVRDKLQTTPEHLRMLHVTGDSMEPTLSHGDVILVDTSQTTASPPGIFVLYDGFGLVVKRAEILPSSPPALSITSDNPQYSPYERSLDDMRIIGRVVWFAREC